MTTSTAKHRAAKAAKARARHKEYEKKHDERHQISFRGFVRTKHANGIECTTGHRPVKWHPFGAGVTDHATSAAN